MNSVNLIGNLVKDLEIRNTASGMAVGRSTIAINKKIKGVDSTSFIDITAFDKIAENIAKFFRKGNKIAITGHLQQDTWEDKQTGKTITKLYVVVDGFDFMQAPKDGNQTTSQSSPLADPWGYHSEDDMAIPF
jgi:single-strand DNA-binding protein